MKKLSIALLAIISIFTSCKKNSDSNPGNSSRTIRYEITGNFSGTLFASYTTATGGTANDQLTSLPWNKEINYASNLSAAIIAVSGNGGVSGQKVVVVIKRGGSLVGSPLEVVANSSGSFSQAAPVVVF